jgi:hypothetical protein
LNGEWSIRAGFSWRRIVLSYLNERRRRRLVGALAGLALAFVGAAALVLLVVITNCSTTACEHWTIRLGLSGTAILSALGQAALVIGGWLVWRSTRGSLQG